MEGQTQENPDTIPEFAREKHIKYLLMMLKASNERLASVECHKIFNLYFFLTGLDVLDALDRLDIDKQHIVNYIYNQQCVPFPNQKEPSEHIFGFLGGPYLGFAREHEETTDQDKYDFDAKNIHYSGNLVYTFPALCCLVMLGDDLSRVNKKAIILGLKQLQLEDGGSTLTSFECDLRFTYAACAISYLLNDWSGINIDKAVAYILACQSYDYAFGFCPGHESHAAATFLVVASLKLMGKEELISNKGQIIAWCIDRQYGGFQGRLNKFPDSCYSFWVIGTLQTLGYESFVNAEELYNFLMICQASEGGICKFPEMEFADPVHTLHPLFGLAMMKKLSLKPVRAFLNITEDTYKKWENLGIKKSE